MNRKAEILYRLGEFLGSGMYERECDTVVERCALGIRRYFEHAVPPAENGLLYPAPEHDLWHLCGKHIFWHYAYGIMVDGPGLREAGKKVLSAPFELDLLEYIIAELEYFQSSAIAPQHRIGGNGWTHAVLNYPRMLKDGLAGYIARVDRMPGSPLRNALQNTLAGITDFLDRAPGKIREEVMTPAKDFRHAMRSFNFFFALDSYDSAGRFDDYMGSFYRDEPDAGDWIRELFRAMEKHDGWHLLYTVKYPEFTRLCLRSQIYSRPNSGLLIKPDTPQEIWEEVFNLWEKGIPCPCLYHEEAYWKTLACYGEDWGNAARDGLAFGGCTETMIAGCSNVGSTEGGINLLALLAANGGEEGYYDCIRREVEGIAQEFQMNSAFAARFRPHLIRTLFVEDCIDRGLEFNAGGARFYGSTFNVAGLTNAANSLAAMRGIPVAFGNDDDRVDEITRELAQYTFRLIRQQKGRLGGPCFPAVILLTAFVRQGQFVDATPDGRAAGAPVVDSIGPVPGTDRQGPTAMIKSVSKLPLDLAAATPVLNVRLQKTLLQESRPQVKALIESFFAMGGMQIQATVADQETLRKAFEDPDAYPDLMVRIGGFCAYFRDLSRQHRQDILNRTEHRM